MSRGLSNCNPGNIRRSKVRYRGEVHPSKDAQFKQFISMPWGYRAMFVLLDTYRKRYGLDTLKGMISRYAPPSENHTWLYIDTVCQLTGHRPNDKIDTRKREVMVPIVMAMSRVENGAFAMRQDVETGWRLTDF